ncbi:MAG: carbohydrate kinase family protein [Cyclobacteriaceae bacterium]
MMERKGILAAGNWIIDQVKIVDQYPRQDALANIQEQAAFNGGAPYNLLKDLALMQVSYPLQAIGLVGDDENGELILHDCRRHGIETSLLQKTGQASTSYTDVMTVRNSGRRTFFHYRGANALLDQSHFQLEQSKAYIFHLGYLLLLDKLDELDPKNRTKASYLFESAQSQGFLTSTDVVSEDSDRFEQVVYPSLPFLDILFVNEYEAEKITGIQLKENEKVQIQKAEGCAQKLIEAGINKYVIIHFPEGVLAMDRQKNVYRQASIRVPGEEIKGTVGAGDAFAAGVLHGIHEQMPIQQCLKLGVQVAASSLLHAAASNGVVALADLEAKVGQWPFRELA